MLIYDASVQVANHKTKSLVVFEGVFYLDICIIVLAVYQAVSRNNVDKDYSLLFISMLQ